jgi:RES domain-containing protein
MNAETAEVQSLFNRIASLAPHVVPLNGVAFRSVGVRYANEQDLVSGAGAAFYGGRWSPPKLKAVYGSLDPMTATKEAYQEFLNYGFAGNQIKPRIMAGFKFKLQRVVNLSATSIRSAIRREIGFSLTDLLDEDWRSIQSTGIESWTQVVGRGCSKAGFEAILCRSSRDRKKQNIVIFPDNLIPGSSIDLMGKEDLPPHPSEWPS